MLKAAIDICTAAKEDHPLAETITESRSIQVRALNEIIQRSFPTSNDLSTTG